MARPASWVIHRTMCEPSDCLNFGDCTNPCYEYEAVVAGDLEAAGAPSDEVMVANAHLIAATRELLDAAAAFMVEYRSNVIDITTRKRLEVAIAKAHGERGE